MALYMWNFSSLAVLVHHINSFERFKEWLCGKEQPCTLHVSDSRIRQVFVISHLSHWSLQIRAIYPQKVETFGGGQPCL